MFPGWSCLSSSSKSQLLLPPQSQSFRRRKGRSSVCVVFSSVGLNGIADIAHNKGIILFLGPLVLIAASVSAAIGQLSKPFISTILYGKRNKFDIRAAFQSGGFPSTHSSAVVATATAVGLERGLSDAIFGLAVVYASLVMYDSQGVRREVGIHAKVLNKIMDHQSSSAPNGKIFSQPAKSYSNSECSFEPRNLEAKPMQNSNTKIVTEVVTTSDNIEVRSADEGGESDESVKRLKESVGHSETEVIYGALLGFFVSLAVFMIT